MNGDGVLIAGGVGVPFLLDSGSSDNFCSKGSAEKLEVAVGGRARREALEEPIVIKTASGPTSAKERLVLDVEFRYHNGEETQLEECEFFIVEEYEEGLVLIGRSWMHLVTDDVAAVLRGSSLSGMSPELTSFFTRRVERAPQGSGATTSESTRSDGVGENADSSDDEDDLVDEKQETNPVYFSFRLTVEKEDDGCMDLDPGEDKLPLPFDEHNPEEVRAMLADRLYEAEQAGLTGEPLAKLREAVLEEYDDTFRTALCPSDGPSTYPPLKTPVDPAVFNVNHGKRAYSKEDSVFMDEEVQRLMKCGAIYRNSGARVASPVLVVNKPHVPHDRPLRERKRLVIDLRAVNAHTTQSKFPLPLLETFATIVSGKRFFGKLDLSSGYWQIALDPSCQEFFSFATDKGVFTPTRLMQGARNAVGPFQAVMTDILDELIREQRCIVYLDDILVLGTTAEDFVDNWRRVLAKLHEYNLKASVKKTTFYAPQIKFCGRLFDRHGMTFDPDHIRSVTSMKPPRTAADLMQFIASANWVRGGVPMFTQIVSPLQHLLKTCLKPLQRKTAGRAATVKLDGVWNEQHDVAFERIKQGIADSTKLAYPDDRKITCVWTDASKYFWAGIVTQTTEDMLERPVADQVHEPLGFVSGRFKEGSIFWPTVEKEGFATIATLDRLSYLTRGRGKLRLFTDHSNLQYIFSPDVKTTDARKTTVDRIERWKVLLYSFHYEIRHVEGKHNTFADLLSRWASGYDDAAKAAAEEAGVAEEEDLRNKRLAKSKERRLRQKVATALITTRAGARQEVASAAPAVPAQPGFNSLVDRIVKAQLEEREEGKVTLPPNVRFSRAQSAYVDRRTQNLYVPDRDGLRQEVVAICHEGVGGHKGEYVTARFVRRRCWWDSIDDDVRRYLKECLICAASKGRHQILRPLLHTNTATADQEVLHMDYMRIRDREAGSEHRYQYVLVIIEELSRYCEFVPCEAANADNVMKALLQWFYRYGLPSKIVSDRGSHFVNAAVRRMTETLGLKHHLTIARAPWSNGRVERVNGELRKVLTALRLQLGLDEDDWPHLLPLVNAVINSSPSRVLNGRTPLNVFTGRIAKTPLDTLFLPHRNDFVRVEWTANDVAVRSEALKAELHTARKEAEPKLSRKASRRRGEDPRLPGLGDLVLCSEARHGRETDKTRPVWSSLSRVMSIDEHGRGYTVENVATGQVVTVHAQFLKVFRNAEGQSVEVTPAIRALAERIGQGAGVVAICGHRFTADGTAQLLVHWYQPEGVPEDKSWEPAWRIWWDAPLPVQRYVSSLGALKERQKIADAIGITIEGLLRKDTVQGSG